MLLVPLQGVEDPDRIPGHYVVVYHENTTMEFAQKHWKLMEGLNVNMTYKYVIGDLFKGFAAPLSDAMVALLQNDRSVAAIHCDGLAHTTCDTQQSAAPSWGLARTSHFGGVDSGLSDYYRYNTQANGQGVTAYILDTGIFVGHPDFGGRAVWGTNTAGGGNTDRNGHGTHCAGTVAGSAYGIAKQARLVAAKVLSDAGSGSYAGIIQGIQWSVNHFLSGSNAGIASMSLGGGSDGGMGAAIKAAVDQGLAFSVAAGNSNGDACRFYPASSPDVICVGATELATSGSTQMDRRSSFSNFGTCVSLFAPGTAITSDWWDGSTNIISGTSMACPHVTGMGAVLLSQNPGLSPVALRNELVGMAQTGLINNVGTGSPNKLLYNNC